jgi:hypothetical protein
MLVPIHHVYLKDRITNRAPPTANLAHKIFETSLRVAVLHTVDTNPNSDKSVFRSRKVQKTLSSPACVA